MNRESKAIIIERKQMFNFEMLSFLAKVKKIIMIDIPAERFNSRNCHMPNPKIITINF